jgi:carnosine N-methyltransferase
MNEDPETMERIAVNKVTNALRNYRTSCEREIQRRKRNLLKATVRRRRQRDEEESTGKGEGKRTTKLFDGRGGKEKVLEEEDMIQSKSDDDQQEMVKRLLQEVYEKGERKSREAVEKNQHFFDCLLETFSSNDADGEDASHLPAHLRVTRDFETVPERERPPLVPGFEDAEKARYVLKNLARDWSEEGREEREKSHDVLVRHLRDVVFKEQLSEIDLMCERMNPEDIARPRVLVPGAGLGRLVYEFAKAGFETEGNEFSYYMLFGSSFLLNCCSEKRPFEIVPYWHSPLNHLSQKDQYRSIVVPDESPCDHMDAFKPGSSMAMCAGDFCEVYGSPEYESHFDAVACCFFLDTAKNIFDYLETIRFCLKKGGTLTSIGPLLWHWVEHSDNNFGRRLGTSENYDVNDVNDDEQEEDLSVEVSLEDLVAFCRALGFRLDQKSHPLSCPYATDRLSMHRTVYDCAFLTFTLVDT